MPITAKTVNQKKYLKALYSQDLVICVGQAGTGKDYVAIGVYLDMILSDKYDQDRLIISRPLVSCGTHDLGSLPGDVNEKTAPYAMPMLAIMHDLIKDPKKVRELLEKKTVEFIPLELMRGYTFTNCCVLLSEMQNSTPQQAIMAITRMGHGSHFCFNGDVNQKDISIDSGLELLIDKLACTELCTLASMTAEDSQRNPKIAKILEVIGWKGSM